MVESLVLDKAKKLLERTVENGCTASEATSSAVALKALLEEHQLSMFDAETHSLGETCVTEVHRTHYAPKHLPTWMRALGANLAKAFDCACVLSNWADPQLKYDRYYKCRVLFLGLASDASVAAYFFARLSDELWKEAERVAVELGLQRGEKTRYKVSFTLGAGQRIVRRVMEEREGRKTSSIVRAMVRVKDREVTRFVEERFPNLKVAAKREVDFDDLAFADGMRHGQTVSLHRGVEGSSSQSRLSS